jgi:hypothetical protein
VAYIKHTGVAANRLVLIVDAAVTDGHVVSGKGSHPGAQFDVLLGERRVLHAKILGGKNNV